MIDLTCAHVWLAHRLTSSDWFVFPLLYLRPVSISLFSPALTHFSLKRSLSSNKNSAKSAFEKWGNSRTNESALMQFSLGSRSAVTPHQYTLSFRECTLHEAFERQNQRSIAQFSNRKSCIFCAIKTFYSLFYCFVQIGSPWPLRFVRTPQTVGKKEIKSCHLEASWKGFFTFQRRSEGL